MSKNSSLLLLGILVIFVSFLGIPSSWKTIAFSILGALIIATALFLRKDITTGALCQHLTEEKHANSYKQNGVLRSNDNNSDNHNDNNNNNNDNQEEDTEQKEEDNEEMKKEHKEEHEHDQNTKKLQT